MVPAKCESLSGLRLFCCGIEVAGQISRSISSNQARYCLNRVENPTQPLDPSLRTQVRQALSVLFQLRGCIKN